MCGLFGNYSTLSADKEELRVRLLSAQRALQHRGPDDQGLDFFSISRASNNPPASLALGHTRLSIIDLSSAGHQPMHSAGSRYTIVFNGEIYNYRELRCELKAAGCSFHTDSDTEVLLAAWACWGVGGLRRLNGMFAFAVYDRQDESLTLVRDAFGIKPLFYSQGKNTFDFASELQALLELLCSKPEINLQQAYDYLVFGHYDSGEVTFYAGVKHLLPAHWVRLDLRSGELSKPQRWWWPSIEERTDLSFKDAAAQLREMFFNNVRLHLRGDVPVGAALSGGVDSSAVVCAMRHLEPDMPIHTFSYVARGSGLDEERWVDIVNRHVGAVAHKVVVSPSELADDFDDMIRAQGEPFGSTSIYAQYRVFKAAREAGITVMLDGQGADELLAGYSGYPDCYLRSLLERRDYMAAESFLWEWSKWPNRGIRRALLLLGYAITPTTLRGLARRVLGQSPTPSWLDSDWLRQNPVKTGFPTNQARASENRGRRLAEQLRFALTGSGLASLLRHGDRDSMRWSIESRVPFLTTELAEFLLRLPESYLLSPRGETKYLLRAGMRGLVPDAILDRRDKIGFQTPEQEWLRVEDPKATMRLASLGSAQFIKQVESRKILERVFKEKKDPGVPLWRLINYQAWLRESGPGLGT